VAHRFFKYFIAAKINLNARRGRLRVGKIISKAPAKAVKAPAKAVKAPAKAVKASSAFCP